MKTRNNLLLALFIILISINSIYPLNINKNKKNEPKKDNKSFWYNHQLNLSNTLEFNSNSYWNQEEIIFFNDRTVTISNKKIATSKDDSYEDNKGNNESTDIEGGNIRWKGYRFQNLNIPANAIINNVELIIYGYKHGNTTVKVKAENLKSPSTYSDQDDYLSSRSTTSKSVNWYIPKLSNGLELKSPNLKDVVQEVVNNKGGITHLSFIIASSKKWEAWNFDDRSSSYYPKINITYTIATPTANDDTATIDENTKASIAIFANDENIPSNASLKISKNPANGNIATKDPNNTPNDKSDDIIEYTPNTNFDGVDSFEYTVCDNKNNCDKALVKITVNSVVDPCDPIASGNLDTDNDGIADVCDLDDDNDGILDTDECPTVTPFSFKLNANNKKFTNSGISGDIGDVMLYRNVGTHLGTKIDLKITVTANSDPQNMTVDISGFKFGDDIYPVLLDGNNTKETPFATVKFEFLKNGTNELVNVSPSFMFKDIDLLGDGSGESVEINKNLVSSYSLSKNPATSLYIVDNVTKNYTGTSGNFLRINSKKSANGLNDEDLWIGLQLLEVNSFNINFLKRNGNTGYVFESDSFSKSANTVQLDSDCSLDTDSDGIPDYLDTDSDNDGCPDASEAEKNMNTTATLAGGSNGGSSANLGTVSNKNGIPLPFGTANGSQTKGQKITNATKTAEKITVATANLNIDGEIKKDITLKIDATATKTNTFANGIPNYDNPNGTDTSNRLTYKWYKKSNPNNILSTKKTHQIYHSKSTDAGEYIIVLTGANSSCSKEVSLTLNINDSPSANKDFGNVQEDSVENSINVLNNDDFGGDGPNKGKITLVSDKSENNGTVSVDDNGTPNNPTDDKLLYTPFANFNGRDIFKYTITDANGDSATAEVSIFVNSVNDLPTASADTFTVDEDSPETKINVTENDDFGGDGPNKGTIAIYNKVTKQKGSVKVDDNGTPKDPTDDHILYTPADSFFGTDEFSYVIIDSNGNRSEAKVTVTVNAVNDTPTATEDTLTIDEDSTEININVLENDDFGDDGASNTAILLVNTTSENGGTLSVNTNNTPNNPKDDSIFYTPLANYNGLDSFKYNITDADGETSTAKVTITINAINDVPTPIADLKTVDEDSTNNTIDVLSNDSFGGDGSNTGKIVLTSNNSDKNGSISVNVNGTPNNPTDDKIIYTPKANYNGTDTFEYSIIDADGDKATAKVTININAVNDLPTAGNDTITVNEDSTNNTINFLANDDFGGDGYISRSRIILTTPSNGGTVKINTNGTRDNLDDDAFTYTPAENFNGTETFTYTITDANGDTATGKVTVTVTSVNDTPTAINDTSAVLEDSANNAINVLTNDDFGGDGANTGTISIPNATSTENGTISVDDNGTATDPTDDKIKYTPFANYQGIDTFTYTITDANGDTATATATITVTAVNDVPEAKKDAITVNEDSTNNIINVLADNGFGADTFGGDGSNSGSIKISKNTTEEKGSITVDDNNTPNNPTDDKINYTPIANFNGTDSFSYSIIDANGDVSTAIVEITVNAVNDLPNAIDDSITVDEDSTKNTIIVLDNDDFGGDGNNSGAIALINQTSTNGGTVSVFDNDTANDPTDDSILYTPKADFNGTDSFEYKITDSNGDEATAKVTVTVTAVNDLPTATADTLTVNEDSTNNAINILENDSFGGDGSNSEAITVTSSNTLRGGTITVDDNGTPNNPTDDKILYTPKADSNTTDTFEYIITDANGDQATAKVTVNINPINDLPTAVDDNYNLLEDASQTTIKIFDNDSFGGDGKPLRNHLSVGELDQGGTLVVKLSRSNRVGDAGEDLIYYTPAPNFNGVETFSYTITDANGDEATAKVTINVGSVNDLPTASNDAVTFNEDSKDNIINVTINDDFGGDNPKSGTISITSASSDKNGTITVDDNETPNDPTDDKIIYTPVANFNGVDTFEYTITDTDGDTSIGKVTITINPVNDIPVAITDAYTVNEDSTNNSFAVVVNDNFGGDGESTSAIIITSENSEKGGTISIDDNGTPTNPKDDKIIYTPLANFNGADTFTYTIADFDGDTATETVYVSITAVNDSPTAVNDAYTVDEDSTNNIISIFNNDSYGGDGKPTENYLEVSSTDQGGTVLVKAGRNNSVNVSIESDIIYYTPAPNFNGIETFTYTIIDVDGDKSTATVSITVNNVNDSPVAINDNISADENSQNNQIDVLNNDSFGGDNPKAGTITLTTNKSDKGGTITVNDNATPTDPTDDRIVYTPLANFTGTDTFEYVITDTDNETSAGTVTVTINPTGTQYNPLAIAECFNIFLKNNLTLGTGTTAGNIATGGDLTFKSDYKIASEDCGCFAINDVKIGLLVGGKVNYPSTGVLTLVSENNYAKIGEDNNNVWYQNPDNSNSPIRITPQDIYDAASHIQLSATSENLNVSNSINPVIEKNIIDFASAFQQLQAVSLSLSNEANNATILDSDYQEIANTNLPSDIVINLESSVNYLNISGDDLNKVNNITFFNKPSANNILIINVDASDVFDWSVWNQIDISEAEAAYIIYNFHNAKTLNLNGTNALIGSLFAPFADISKTTNTASISGQIIGKSLTIDAGNNNCNVFDNDVYSPEDAKIAPIAAFTINNNTQCLVGNTFQFTNASNTGSNTQPTSPISYAWDFGDGTTSSLMNPSITYTEAGTYNVKLTATNTYGTSEKTTQVIVEAIIVADVLESNSIRDENAGTVTKEFTLNNNIDYTNFTWSLDGFDTSSFDNQKIVSFQFIEEGEHTLVLNTTNNGCDNIVEIPVTVTSDEVSTGNDGGLESESLGDAISIRYLQRKMKSVPTIFKKTKEKIYNKKKMVKSLARKSNELSMLEMFPERLVDGDVAHVTSPTDILDFTVADEVLSVDFSVDDKTIGVVLGVKTLDQIYNHTKATCDRLRGAEILNVKTVEIGGYNFLQQAIKQRNGIIEHAISFAVSKNKSEEFYRLQTNWYVFDYIAANDVFNFQVWASEPDNTVKMVTEILANLNDFKTVEQIEKQKVPKTFVTKVARVSDKLNLNLKSFEETEDLEISIEEKLNETTSNLNLRYTPLNNKKEQTLQLDINDGYEYDGDIVFDGEVQDAFYHADGNWGLDYDRRFTTVNDYEVTNNFEREYEDDELPINRNVTIKAYSEYDYLTVYKSLLPGTLAADYTAYNYLTFKAKGNGPTQLVLVKSGIEDWSEQFRATVNLTDEEQTFFIPFESFTSTATTDKIVADDLTTISFTYVAVDAGTNDLDMKISDVKFTKTNTSLSVDEFISPKKNEFFTYPNPSKGDVNYIVFSDTNTKARAVLVDITGKIVYEDIINLFAGKNELKLNYKVKAGVMFLKINSKEINYGTSKIIFR